MDSADEHSHSPSHGHSRHMRMASVIGMVIANAKEQKRLELRDVIAGIYVANFERVLRFWPDAATFEDFIAEHCDWSENRLLTWGRWTYELLHPPRPISIPFTSWFFLIPRKHSMKGKGFTESDELKRVYATAHQLSPNRITAFGKTVPLVTAELFLLAIARTDGVELGKRLVEAGLRLDLLESVATKQLEFPEKLRF